MMELTFSQLIFLYVDNEMKNFTPICGAVFTKIARHSFGNINKVTLVPKKTVCADTGISEKSTRGALQELSEKGLIVETRGGGRGHPSGYEINMEYFTRFLNMAGYSRKNKPGKINQEKNGAFSTSREPLLFSSQEVAAPTRAASPPPDKPAVPKNSKKKNTRSEEEREMFAEAWTMFETALGGKITGKSASLEAKSIWELIDTMNNGNGWRSDVKAMIERFISYVNDPPDGFDYLSKCLPLPHILVSPRTWQRMTMAPRTEARGPTLEETEAYFRNLREEGVIK